MILDTKYSPKRFLDLPQRQLTSSRDNIKMSLKSIQHNSYLSEATGINSRHGPFVSNTGSFLPPLSLPAISGQTVEEQESQPLTRNPPLPNREW